MQANLERRSINKKSNTRKNKQNLNTPILILSILILLSCVLFLTIDIKSRTLWNMLLSKRVPKLISNSTYRWMYRIFYNNIPNCNKQ